MSHPTFKSLANRTGERRLSRRRHVSALLSLVIVSLSLTSVQAAPLSEWYAKRIEEVEKQESNSSNKEKASSKAEKGASEKISASKSKKGKTGSQKDAKQEEIDQEAFDQEAFDQEAFDQEAFDQEVFEQEELLDHLSGTKESWSSQKNGYANPQVPLTLHETKLQSPSFGYATIGRSMLPEGWYVQVTDLSLGTESITCPNAVWVTVTSPSQDVTLTYISRRDFFQEYVTSMGYEVYSQEDSFDWGSLKYYWSYKDAREVCDYFAQTLSGDPAKPVSTYSFNEEEENSLRQAYQSYDSEIRSAIYAFNLGEVKWTELSSERITYDLGEDRLTVFSNVSGYQYEKTGYGYLLQYTNWSIPELFAIRTRAEEHDAYEELFDVFCATTGVSQEYALLREKNAQELVRALIEAQENQWSSPSIDEGTLTENQEDTIDQGDTYSAFEAWDDLIRDETDYTTGDGSHIKISNQYDHVFEGDDGTIYAGSSPDGPIGSTELSPSQIGW